MLGKKEVKLTFPAYCKGLPPIFFAAEYGRVRLARQILGGIKLPDDQLNAAFMIACSKGRARVAVLLSEMVDEEVFKAGFSTAQKKSFSGVLKVLFQAALVREAFKKIY